MESTRQNGAKFRAIFQTLRDEIAVGKYRGRFPSQEQLVRRFGVARLTVIRALEELQHGGMIVRRKGAGTFVVGPGTAPTRRIGLIAHGSSYCEIFAPIARAVSHLCQEHGYTLLFADVAYPEDRKRVVQVIRLAREYVETGVDGVILQPVELIHDAASVNRELIELFDAARVPVVLLDSDISPERSACDLASVDHFDAARRLALHLRAAGARRIAYLMQPNRAPCVLERQRGVAAGAAGLALAGETLYAEPDDLAAVKRFLSRKRPDAFACFNDRQAAILVKTLVALGKRVPDDVQVAGFDDVNYATLATPTLTTMHQPCEELAALAFDLLVSRIRKPKTLPRACRLSAPLVVRESTRPVVVRSAGAGHKGKAAAVALKR